MTHHRDEDVPPMQPELIAFLKAHDEVGEPTPGELRRGRERLLDAVNEERKVVPLRRRWLPPEVLAVAAVLFVAMVAQLVYVTVKRGDALLGDEKALEAAWSQGSLQALKRAVDACTSTACSDTGTKMLAALSMSSRIDSLDATELSSLSTLNEELSKKGPSPISERITRRRQQLEKVAPPPAPAPPAAPLPPVVRAPAPPRSAEAREYIDAANGLRREKNYDAALARAEACVEMFPENATCWRVLGSVVASIAARDQSTRDQQRARAAYEKFLALAEPGDQHVPRVREILGIDDEDGQPRFAQPRPNPRPAPEPQFEPSRAVHVKVKKGASISVDVPVSLQRLAVGTPDIVDVVPEGGNRLRVTGLKPGTCHVVAWMTNGLRAMWIVEVN